MPNTNLILRTLTSPYGDNTLNSVLSHADLDNNFIYLKGGIIKDVSLLGANLILTKIDDTTLSVNLNNIITGTGSATVTGGTYDNNTGIATFTNSTGGTFNVSGFTTGSTGDSLYWYSENATPPTVAPSATGVGSIALGDGAEALSSDMFVYGTGAGQGATNASFSNFFGQQAGFEANDATSSNLFGTQAGYQATGASQSNFFGGQAGYEATNAFRSNFFGEQAGYQATEANSSNFFGETAGYQASGASYSNFIGLQSGYLATNAEHSNFFGEQAGSEATNAAYSIFIGRQAGLNDTVDNTENGLSSILIGSYTNTGGFSNSILLGSGANESPIANTKENQFMLADTITDVRWGGIEYELPSTQAANAGDVLSNDGTGVLSWATAGTLRGLFTQTGNSTIISATTVETTLIDGGIGTLTVPANGFKIGDSFRAIFGGVMNAANNQTIRIRIKAGSVLLLDSGVQALTNSIINDIFSLNLDFTIRKLGGAGVASIVTLGTFHYTKTSNNTIQGFGFNIVNSTTFDTTISNTLDVTVQWGSNNAGNNIYSDIFILNRTY